ncbi:MAG: hypothetical protein JST54_22775 [Deltaproteobacteria bacterium]|nr:hypothetical protein [Deltaproteobacteria bacterium]
MVKLSETLSFEVPDSWSDDSDARQLILHGPSGEEVIGSVASVQGQGAPDERPGISEKLLGNALDALTGTLDDPGLRRTAPALATYVRNNCRLWRGDARSTDGVTFFAGIVACDDNSVLLLTFEAPFSDRRASDFDHIVETICPRAQRQ